MSKMLEGQPCPDFSLPDAEGKILSFKDFKGMWIVLYFYPKDDTPGCTTEARAFTKRNDAFLGEGAVVIGVSSDSCESHYKFIQKHALNVVLLSDGAAGFQKQCGVWGPKNPAGSVGTHRTTFLVNPLGRIVKIWENVDPEGHADEVLEELRKQKQL